MITGTIASHVAAGALVALVAPKLRARLMLSRAKHRSLAGHSRMSRRVAGLLPRYAQDDATFFAADDAGPEIAGRRRAAFERLSGELRTAGFEPSQRVVDGEVWVGYWVHLAGIPTRETANEILERLRANGIADSYIVPGAEESQIISLGVFSEISRAAGIREQVRALGYDPTVADRSRRATLYWIDIRAAGDAVIDLEALQPPGRINRLEQRPCPAAR